MAKKKKRVAPAQQPEQQAVAPTLVTVTIPAGQSLSNGGDISAKALWRVRMPPAWTTPPGGKPVISFQISTDNIAWMDLCKPDGTEMTAQVIPGGTVPVTTDLGEGVVSTYIKVRSGLRDAPYVQSAARDFVFVIG